MSVSISLIFFPLFGIIDTDLPTVINNSSGTVVAKFAADGVDTGGKFAIIVVDTGGKFAAGDVDSGGKFATGVIDTGGAPRLANISMNF